MKQTFEKFKLNILTDIIYYGMCWVEVITAYENPTKSKEIG